jgi:hypothetical protein
MPDLSRLFKVSARVEQVCGGPAPRAPAADDQKVNPDQSFPCKFAGKCRKWAFFGQRWNFISRPRFFRPAKPAPLDRAHQRRPGASELAGLPSACAESRHLQGPNGEDFTTIYRSLRLKLKFKFIKLLRQVQSSYFFKHALCGAALLRRVETIPYNHVLQVFDAHLRA